MAKNKKHIDDLFKDNLQGSQLPLDGSEWVRLFDELHPKKKKRFAWWWFGIGILLVSATGLLYVNITTKAGQALTNNPAGLQEIKEKRQEKRDFVQENFDEKKELREKGEERIDDSEDKRTEQREKRIENGDGTGTDLASKNREQRDKTVDQNIDAKSTNVANSKPTKSTNNNAGSKNNSKPEQVATTSAKNSTTRGDLVTILAKTNIDIPWRINPFGAPLLTMYDKLDQAPPIYAYPMEGLIDSLDPIKRFINPYIGLSVGGSQMNQSLQSDIINYTTYRTGNESSSFLPNLGFDIGAGFKGMQIASGIKYLEKGQQSNPQFKYEIYDSILRVDAHGDTSYPRYNYRDTTVNGAPSPRYRYMSIPISIGKTFFDNDKIDLTIGINSNIQFLVGGTGTILNEDLSRMSVQRLSGFNRLSLTYGGYFSAGYAVTDRMKLKLLVRYDADALDMMKHNDISQKMSGFGTDFSLQFKLKK